MGIMFKVLIIAPMLVIQFPAFAKQQHAHQDLFFQQSPSRQRDALCELLAIPSYHLQNLKQPHTRLSELYKAAPEAQSELENIAKTAVCTVKSGNVFSSGFKGRERANEKVKKELAGDASRLTDVVRVTLAANSVESLIQIYNAITSSAQTLSVANRFKSPRPSGYRDIKILIKLPKSQLIAEVQLHLTAIANIKNNKEHHIYREIQKIERRATTSSRELREVEVSRINKLHQRSRRLYNIAWQRYEPHDDPL